MRPKAKFVWPDGREKIIDPVKHEDIFKGDMIAFLAAIKRHNAEKEGRLINLEEEGESWRQPGKGS